MRVFTILVLAYIQVGCALLTPIVPPPQFEYEGRLALRAVEIQDLMVGVLEAAEAAHENDFITTTQLRQFAQVGLVVGHEGVRLGEVLETVDTTKSQAQGIALGQATVMLAAIETAVGTLSGSSGRVPSLVQTGITALVRAVRALGFIMTDLRQGAPA